MRQKMHLVKKLKVIEEYDLYQDERILNKDILKDLANQYLQCSGEEPMYMQRDGQKVGIFLCE